MPLLYLGCWEDCPRMLSRWRTVWLVPLIILICSVAGGVFGQQGVAAAAAAGPEDDIKASLKSFTKLYELVEDNFADKVTADKAVYKGAIPGMLRTLDPHSNFFDPKDFQLLKEDQRGHYYGVGMTIQPRNGRTIVLKPFGKSPAHRAGIRPGDAILEVNDKKTDNLTSSEVAEMLKGPRGTHVQIKIGREGLDHPLTFDIVRDEIPRASVMEPFWIRPGIAYVRINSFSETTSHEVEDGLKKLGEQNVKGLVLDLRARSAAVDRHHAATDHGATHDQDGQQPRAQDPEPQGLVGTFLPSTGR